MLKTEDASHVKVTGLIDKAAEQAICHQSQDPIDWNLPIQPPDWLSDQQYVRMVSNLIYGEKATVKACEKLQAYFGPGSYTDFLTSQIQDEQHHAHIYERYLQMLDREIDPSPEWCDLIGDCLDHHTSPVALMLAFHVLLEGEAVFLQKLIGKHMSCPLFRQMNDKIRTDEARHAAFGRVMLPELIKQEPKGLMTWARDLWFASANILVAEYLDPAIRASGMLDHWLETRWAGQEELLSGLGVS